MKTLFKKLSGTLLAKISKRLPIWIEDELIPMLPALKAQRYQLPVNNATLPADLAAHYEALTANAPDKILDLSIYITKNANVSFVGAPFKNLQLFRPEMSPYIGEEYRSNYLLMQWLAPRHYTKRIAKVALVHDIWGGQNYYHWLVESLPRLLMLRKAFPDVAILLPTPTPSFIQESLKLLNFTSFIPIAKTEYFKVDELIIPQKLPFLNLQLEDAATEKNEFGLLTVRESILANLNLHKSPNSSKPHRFVYVSRARQSFRRIINEKEIEVLLKEYNFETFYFEEMSFEQQVSLMQETAVLIGLHGANMANLMFMPPGARVVELMNVNSGRLLFYFFMASYFNLPYYCMPCTSVDSVTTNQSDVVINVISFAKLLASIFEKDFQEIGFNEDSLKNN